MQMNFYVGVQEQHLVEFSWDQFWGLAKIKVDGIEVIRKLHLFSMSLVQTYDFSVGFMERHNVRIEKHRSLFMPAFRSQPVIVYIDGIPVASAEASLF